MPSFDWSGAKEAGYSDAEIADFLAGTQKFDTSAAREAGYSDPEIITYLQKRSIQQDQMAQLREEGRQAQIRSDVLQAYESDADVPALMRSELGRQVARGFATAAGGVTGLSAILTPGETSQRLLEASRGISGLADIPTTAAQSLGEIKSIGDVHGYVGGLVAQQIPQLLAAGAGAGAVKLAGAGTKLAGFLGPMLTTAPQEAGSIYSDIVEQTGQTGARQRATALGAGIASGALESLGVESALSKRLLREAGSEVADELARRNLRSLLKDVGASTLGEGITEAGQEAVAIGALPTAGGNLPSGSEIAARLAEAGAAGLLTGGVISGAQTGIAAGVDALGERRRENAYQDALNRLARQSVDRGNAPVAGIYGTPLQESSDITGGPDYYFREGRFFVGPSGTRISNAERRRLEQEALTQAQPEEPAVPEEVVAEQRVGQYPTEGFGTGVIPSQQELERRSERRRQVAERNRAEAEARRAEAFGELAANPQEEARIMAQLVAEEAAARAKVEEDDRRIMAGLEVEQAAAVLGQREAQGAEAASRFGAAPRPIAEAPREQLGMSPNVLERLRLLRQQEEAAAQAAQQPTQQVREETVQVPEARQPVVQEGGQGAQGVGRVDRPTEVRQGAVPADVAGGPQVAPATTLLYGDSTEIAPDDTVEISGKAFGPEVSKVLHKARIRGAATRNQDGSISIRVTDAGISEKRGRSADAPVPRVQQAGFALNDTITFRSRPSGLVRVERRNAQGQESAPAVEIRPTKGLFSKVERVVQEAPAVDAQTSTILQSIFGAVEDPRFARFSELFDKVIFKKATEEEATEFEALDKSLTPTESTLLRAAYYRQVGPQQMRLMVDNLLTQAGLVVDDTDIENAWDKEVANWVSKRMTRSGSKTNFALRKAQNETVIDLIRKAQRRGPVASSTVPEDAETSPIPEPASGMGPAAAPTARTTDIGEASASQASAEEALLNADAFSALGEDVRNLELSRRGQRITDDELVQILTRALRKYNPDRFDALRASNTQIEKSIVNVQEKVKAIYKQGGSKILIELADAYDRGDPDVISLLSRPWSTPIGLSVAGVQSHLALRYGIRPDSGMVGVISIPGADFNGRLLTLRSTGQPIGIQINAATVSSLAEVDKVLQHELAEMALAQGVARDVLSQISAAELAEIRATVSELGYDPSNDTEVDARIVEQLVAAYRNRNWFQRVVANVLAWANSKGLKITRLAAELIAARAVAAAQADVVSGTTNYNLGEYSISAILQPTYAAASNVQSAISRESKAKALTPEQKNRLSEAAGTIKPNRSYWVLPDGAVVDVAEEGYNEEGTAFSHGIYVKNWIDFRTKRFFPNKEEVAVAEAIQKRAREIVKDDPSLEQAPEDGGENAFAGDLAYNQAAEEYGWVRVKPMTVPTGDPVVYAETISGNTSRPVTYILNQLRERGMKVDVLAGGALANRPGLVRRQQQAQQIGQSWRDFRDYGASGMSFMVDDDVDIRESRTTFTKREKVADELGQPGLLPDQQDIIESSAAAQAGVVPASIKATITAAGLSPRSRTALSWLGKVFDLSASPKPLSSLNPDDNNTMQIASAVMGQVDRVRKNRSDLILKLEKLREQMLSPRRAQILSELATANAAANAAGAASSGLTRDFRAYNRQEILTYAGTDASLKNAVTKASDAIRLLYTESKEINKAFEVMAENVPDAVIAQAKTLGNNQPIFDYVINSKMLDGKVSKSVIDALTVAPATGKLAPLQSYRGLASALRTIKDYTADVSKAKADRKAFEALFAATSPSTTAKAKRVDIEDYARRYRALRNAEQDAVDRIRSLSREIEALDNALLDTIEQIGVLDSVMGSAEYTDSANTASNLLNLFAPEILGVPDPNGVRHVVGGTPYVIPSKFDPETDRDAAGRVLSLSNAVNARLSQIASGTEPVDPVERRTLEHLRLKLQQFAGNTAGNAALRIGPFNPARLRRKIPILRSLISRRHLARIIPGRLSGELNMLNAAGDSLEKALDGQARRDKSVGINALNVATSRALASHPGMDPLVWKAEVLNEILNANQKDTDFRVTAGMTTPFGHTVTKEDIDAAKLQARFGHKVYSVSTAKDRGGVLRFFPNMIMEGNRLRLPFVTGAMTTPRRLVRDEVEGGPVYYAKQIEQALENPDEASRKAEIERILNEPNAFTLMARRYVWETNSEFKNRSPYAKIYRKLAVDWWTNKTAAPTNLDELVDQIAAFVPGTANTQQEVRDSLINEIVAASKASLESQRTSIQEAGEYVKNGVGDEGFSAEVFSPSAVVSVVDSFNQFTKPRGDMVAPGSFYDYTLATDESQNALIVAAMMPLRIRQLRALMDLQRELMKHKTNLAQRMNLNPQSVKQDLKNGKLYLELSEVSEVLQVLSDALETFKGRVSAPNIAVDNGLLRAWNAVHKALLVNALTAATGNILFGIAGGDTAARVMTRGYTPRTGISALAAGPRVLLNIVERAFANNPDAVRFIKKNRSKLGALGARMMRQAELYAEIEAAARRGGWRVDEETAAERAAQVAEVGGFRSPIRSRGELRDSLLNRIERKLSKRAIVRVKEALFRFQPAGDEVANDLNAKTALTNLTLLFQAGYNIIKNRAASGVPNWDNWTDPNNFIRPEEAKQVAGWSPEILFWLKENMAPAGSLEYLLHDYYKRVEAAKAAGTDPEAVAPLADEDALADVMIRILSASNLPADSSRADLIRSSSGMGQALSFFWGFPGWINNWLDSLEGFSSISSERRSQLERLAMPVIYTMALTALLALSGLWPNELLALFYELVNGRPYNVMTAREFASAPTPAALGKLLAVSLARMVPYAGEYIAGYVGATQNKPSMTDLSKMSIPLGVLANFSNALETAWKTGDIAGAALGLTRSTLPILNPIVNRIAPQGRDAINDAVRVATRNAGDLEIKTRPGGGGGFEPTEFSSLIKRAVAANANGDAAGAKALLQKAADVKAKSGVADPWSAVKSSLKAQAPDFKTFGRTISDGERAGLLGRMSASQRGIYQTAENAVSSLLSGIGTKAEREAASGGGGGMVAAQRQIRAITGTPKPIKAIRKQLRAAMPKGLKLKRSRGTRLGGTKLRLPKGTSVASLSSSRLLRQGPQPTVALGRAYREQRRRGAAGLPLGPMTYGGMPSVARGY